MREPSLLQPFRLGAFGRGGFGQRTSRAPAPAFVHGVRHERVVNQAGHLSGAYDGKKRGGLQTCVRLHVSQANLSTNTAAFNCVNDVQVVPILNRYGYQQIIIKGSSSSVTSLSNVHSSLSIVQRTQLSSVMFTMSCVVPLTVGLLQVSLLRPFGALAFRRP